MKICSTCGLEKYIAEFGKRRQAKDGHRGQCLSCLSTKSRTPHRNELAKKWRDNNKEKLARKRKVRRLRVKLEVMEHYGGAKCACCGETRVEFLCFDHINGGGNEHRRQISGWGRQLFYWLKLTGYPEGYRVLCHNCNMALGFYGYCPHDKDRV